MIVLVCIDYMSFSHSSVSTEQNVQYALCVYRLHIRLHIRLLRYVHDLQFDAKEKEEMIGYRKRSTLDNARVTKFQHKAKSSYLCEAYTQRRRQAEQKKPHQNEILIFTPCKKNCFLRSAIRLVECIQW